jgi:hypothetical protein
MRSRLSGNRMLATAGVLLVSGLLVAGLSASAAAGPGDGATVAAKKKKKKKCPAGTTKVVKKKKNGKKKITCVPAATPTPPLPATLSITPSNFDFGGVNQGGLDNCNPPPDPDCPTQVFTVTNAGPGPTGTLVVSLTHLATDGNGTPGFQVFATTCAGALAPGGSCTVTIRAGDDANFTYMSRLDVSATPGSVASATMQVS